MGTIQPALVNCPVCLTDTRFPCDNPRVAEVTRCAKKSLREKADVPQRQSFNEAPKAPALDTQVGGSHYKDMPIQPMTYSMVNGLDACQHTIIKYVSRFREKGGIEDLEKAIHCTELLIEFEREKLQK
ncbi:MULTISPECIES: DUF3310 domain-containing protein [unclassified Mesorhizobium]|uniref:DUF3310 domain-containing protein n=1 Tax=unclassified Mesorhizobium TaxID=325217 RepID=UPI001FD9C7F2|nr:MULTISPECIES: DUF3310 domain-containing protein [unclassified Mesorhizobium]WJI53017.1 DUF3310 domain-containing protein [Mesorhizobium sp. C089B]